MFVQSAAIIVQSILTGSALVDRCRRASTPAMARGDDIERLPGEARAGATFDFYHPTERHDIMTNPLFRVAALLLLPSALAAAHAQSAPVAAPAATKPAPQLIAVSAPNAQALIARVAAAHSDVFLLGLHANVPGTTSNAIIACSDAPRIGKPSSAGDLALIGKTKIVVAKLPAKNVYEVAMPISDAQGRSFGMIVDQMKIAAIKDEVDALQRALALRAEVERGIQSEAWLFDRN
ncbi:hypothetical protein [Sphingomonas nostoxanthinifaciens]|uniref:hypothetical protein n=1 Tax=Sphingomonas nostoxanthinifaciens TaxID=2872652 RepID=UPI001CC21ACB|nr:hypothetical protein [Sphingomonas nostoxanthinifaciens]UAK23936.1 hypothetical protein K8P63_16465 [Sphingomonas nostoxanthinifaciens]